MSQNFVTHCVFLTLSLSFSTGVRALDLYYDFEGDSGTTVTDKLVADGAQNGQIFNEVSFATQGVPFGTQAARFAPRRQQPRSTLEIPGTTELGSAFTLAVSFDTTDTDFTRLFSSFRGSGAVGVDRILVDMDVSGAIARGLRAIINNTVVETSSVPDGLGNPGYRHVAVTYDDGDVRLYFNGSEVASGFVGPGPLVTQTHNLQFGEDPHDGGGAGNEQFHGNIDDLLFAARVFSAEDIATIASSGVVGNVAPDGARLVHYGFEGGAIEDGFFIVDGPQNGIAHNSVSIDTDAANAAFGTGSLRFDDASAPQPFSVIEIPDTKNLGAAFTLAVSFDTTDTDFTRLFSSFRGTGAVGVDRMLVDMDVTGGVIPGIRVIINNTVVQTASPPEGLGNPGYRHVAITYDDGDVRLYFNGSEVASGFVGTPLVVQTHNLQFGEDPHDGGGTGNEQFHGHVDELLVLGQVLSGSGIATLAASGVAGNVTPGDSLAVYYDFEGGDTISDRFVSDGAQNGVIHNSVRFDTNAVNAAFGSGSAILDDPGPTIPFSVIDVGLVGNLGSAFTMAATVNVPGGGFGTGGLTRLFSTHSGTGSPAGRLIFDFDPNASVVDIGLRVILPDGTVAIAEQPFSTDENHHLAAVYDQGDLTLYLDGDVVGTGSTSGDVDLGLFLSASERTSMAC